MEVCVARDCFDHKLMFSPKEVADAIEAAMKETRVNAYFETTSAEEQGWLDKISELRKTC